MPRLSYEQPEWLDNLTSGNEAQRNAAFRSMLSEWQRPVYYHVRRMLGNHSDADDVVQETFIQVHRSVHKFRKDAQFSTWLFTISGRKALDWIRKNERHRSTSLDEVFALRDSDLATDVLYGGDEIERRLDAAVLSLPPKQRQVFTLRYFQKMKYQEMSKITGTSEGALKASYYHAVRKIKKHVALESVGL